MGDNKRGLKQKQERLEEVNISNEGYKMKIIKYNRFDDIVIEFQDEYRTKISTTYQNFKKGKIKNPYHKSIFNVGYIGQGKYKPFINGKQTKAYQTWKNMIMRCYDAYYINKRLTYIDCFVCEEWHCFQNFAEWFYKNYYEVPNDRMELDKDILIKGNKIYSSKTCILVPERINILFVKRNIARGNYPIGVSYHEASNKFQVSCGILDKENNKKVIYLGTYNTIEEAFLAYKIFKENYIKQVADEYKDLIPQRLYDAMYKYEVEIND